jgi:hypothetical protein
LYQHCTSRKVKNQRTWKGAEPTQIPSVSHKPLGNFQQRSAGFHQSSGARVVKGAAQCSPVLSIRFVEVGRVVHGHGLLGLGGAFWLLLMRMLRRI